MSYYDYEQSKKISSDDPQFAALIMAAIRKADSNNAEKLAMAFPFIYAEFQARYHVAGGILPGEKVTPPDEDTCELSSPINQASVELINSIVRTKISKEAILRDFDDEET